MQGPSCLSQTHGTLLIPPSCPHRAQERDPLLQVRLQHHTTRLFVGHSLVVGGMAPCTCNLCKQVVHTHPPLCGVAFNKSFHDKVGLFMKRKETRGNSNSLGKQGCTHTGAPIKEWHLIGVWETVAKEKGKIHPQFTLLDRNFTVAAVCWDDWLCSLKSERKKEDHSGVLA